METTELDEKTKVDFLPTKFKLVIAEKLLRKARLNVFFCELA